MIERIENSVIFGLINTKANKELLEKVPHRHFLDVSVIYYIADSREPEDSTGKIISNSMLETAGINEQNLFLQAEQTGENLYVLPSSIHEFIAVPASHFQPEELRSIVEQVNMSSVSPEERLSGDVYYYDRNLKVLGSASRQDSENAERSTYGN